MLARLEACSIASSRFPHLGGRVCFSTAGTTFSPLKQGEYRARTRHDSRTGARSPASAHATTDHHHFSQARERLMNIRRDDEAGPGPRPGESFGRQLWRLLPALARHMIVGAGDDTGRSVDVLRRLWWDLRRGHDHARRRARFILAASAVMGLVPAVAVGLTAWLLLR
uniref:hypothetical protein n=1 Tax=Amycolatopsis sp. CA-096443 TaxID=3239919 RepID=UPI003F492072